MFFIPESIHKPKHTVAQEREELHIAPIQIGKHSDHTWWDITLAVRVRDKCPVEVTVINIQPSP